MHFILQEEVIKETTQLKRKHEPRNRKESIPIHAIKLLKNIKVVK